MAGSWDRITNITPTQFCFYSIFSITYFGTIVVFISKINTFIDYHSILISLIYVSSNIIFHLEFGLKVMDHEKVQYGIPYMWQIAVPNSLWVIFFCNYLNIIRQVYEMKRKSCTWISSQLAWKTLITFSYSSTLNKKNYCTYYGRNYIHKQNNILISSSMISACINYQKLIADLNVLVNLYNLHDRSWRFAYNVQ